MSDLIKAPDTPWRGFLKGAGATALAVGAPLTGTLLIRFWNSGPFRALAFSVVFTVAASLAVGLGLALWRLVQGWAYRRFTEGP